MGLKGVHVSTDKSELLRKAKVNSMREQQTSLWSDYKPFSIVNGYFFRQPSLNHSTTPTNVSLISSSWNNSFQNCYQDTHLEM